MDLETMKLIHGFVKRLAVGHLQIYMITLEDLGALDAVQELAMPHYKGWWGKNLDIQIYPTLIIQPPTKKETIEAYLQRISSQIHAKRGCKSIEWDSLRSFSIS